MRVTISIDDNHPETGWGVEGDVQMNYLEELNKEFGAKFTLFIPSNYHYNFPISQYKDWIDWLLSKKYFELAAHGHYHETTSREKWGECEFFELQNQLQVQDRIKDMLNQWDLIGHKPAGWRNPGWLASPESCLQLQTKFDWVAVHYEHNRGLNWGKCKTFFGHDGINEQSINVHNGDIVMFQSHIAGEWNKNIWNEQNYETIRLWLQSLQQNYTSLEFKTLSECL